MIEETEPPAGLAEIKRRARVLAKERRDAMTSAERNRAAAAIHERLLEVIEVSPESVVSGYLPIGSELDVRPLLQRFRDLGHMTVLPCVVSAGAPLVFRTWTAGDPLVPEPFGTFAPGPAARIREPDLIITPLLAFDPQGQRLGYGGGFYDRTLLALRDAKSVIAVGAAFAVQEVREVPTDETDEALDLIITERRVVRP